MTPLSCLEMRFKALNHQDYQTLYASYHPDSPFLQQFTNPEDYLDFAEQQLKGIIIERWRCVDQRQLGNHRAECLLVMEMASGAESQYFYESALLIQVAGTWLYHSAQKLGADDYSGLPDQISFDHFDRVIEKIRF